MIDIPEVNEYVKWVMEKPKKTNKKIKKLIQNIVIPTLGRTDVFFDKETYSNCIKYCESNYYPLFPYQKFIYAFVFMYVDEFPLFSTFVILMGRGNGKDGFIMPLLNFLQTPLYGIKNYNIDIIANCEDQAKDSYKVVHGMLESHKQKFKGKFDYNLETIINVATGAEMKFNTSNPKTKDGKKDGALFFNEYHAYENYEQIKVFESGLGKIDHPRKFIVSTQGYVREGPLDELLETCIQVLDGEENILEIFPFLAMLDDKDQVDDPENWILANPSIEYRPTLARQIKKDYYEAKKIPSKWPEFMTKRMNLPERNESITVTSHDNIMRACFEDVKNKISRKFPEVTASQNAIIGIDYADVRDFASAGILIKIGGEYIWRQHTWICANSPFLKSIKFPIFEKIGMEGFNDYEIVNAESLDPEAIVLWCVEQMNNFNIIKIIMDMYRFRLFKVFFEKYGFTIETCKDKSGMVRMIRNIASIEALTIPLIEKSFADDLINFGNSAIMRWYTNNTGMSIDKKFGNKSYFKIEPKLRKNDGFMSFTAAMSAAELLDETIIYI